MARETNINIVSLRGAKRRSNLFKQSIVSCFVATLLCIAFSMPAFATYVPFNTKVNMNLGIGTSSPGSNLSVLGSESLGAYATNAAPAGGLIASGNVGIGSSAPGQLLDVQGTVRSLYFSGNGAGLTNVAGTNYWNYSAAANIGVSTTQAVGIGTTFVGGTGEAALSVMNGNVGIGTWVPGQILDVKGTVRTTGFAMTGQSPLVGYVLTASDTNGNATWSSAGGLEGWTVSGGNVYTTTGSNNVGIGTTTPQGGLVVTNGNVGIGTWTTTGGSLIVKGGNVGIGTAFPAQLLDVFGTVRDIGEIVNGNVGIGTWVPGGSLIVIGGNIGVGLNVPGQALDVNGTVRTTSFIMTGHLPNPGYVLTSSDSGGSGTWSSPFSLGINYWIYSAAGNIGVSTTQAVGIGTTFVGGTGEAALSIMNGNVGIGTWVPNGALIVKGGNVGIGSNAPGQALDVIGTMRDIGEIVNGNVGIGTYALQTAFAVNGNVGIGTWTAAGGNLIVNGGGNVGIGSAWPGQLVDVQGTVRALNFVGNGAGLTGVTGSNYWNYTAAGNIGVSTIQAVGIGTTFVGGTGEAALSVMNGNVGIGTWVPGGALVVMNGNVGIGSTSPVAALSFAAGTTAPNGINLGDSLANIYRSAAGIIQFDGGIGIGGNSATISRFGAVVGATVGSATAELNAAGAQAGISVISTGQYMWTNSSSPSGTNDTGFSRIAAGIIAAGNGTSGDYSGTFSATNVGIGTFNVAGGSLIVKTGNVGIGSLAPGHALDVQGTIRTINFTMTGQTPLVGYVLTASDNKGNATWSSAGGIAGWTVSGGNVYTTTGSNNVGIGTSTPQGGFVVTNGNVGIGTWVPAQSFEIGNRSFDVTSNGNLGIGTVNPTFSIQVGLGGSSTASPATIGFVSNAPGQASRFSMSVDEGQQTANGDRYQFFSYWGTEIHGTDMSTPPSFTGGTSSDPSLTVFGGGSNTNPILQLDNNAGSSIYLTVSGAGNVGIGSLNPGQALDVTGTVRAIGEVVNGNVGIGTSFVNGIGEGALTVMNGNVGIGTWLPGALLQVNGNVTVASSGQFTGRIKRRVVAVTQSATPSIDTDNMDIASITGLAQAITSMSSGLSGVPNNGDMLMVQITDNGTPQGISWGSSFISTNVTLPTSTTASTLLRILFQYNSVTSKWECIASD